MKYVFFSLVFLTALMTACNDDDTDNSENCTLEGRWIVSGFENTLYQFTDSLRYTIYSTDGTFGPLEDAIPGPHEYMFSGDSLIIDLNFGNFSRSVPSYKCDCNVLNLTDGSAISVLYKEGYNLEDCDQ